MCFAGSHGLPYLCDLLPPHSHNFSLSVCVFSSESEIEEEEEEEGSCRHRATSEEARASWRETLQLHLRDDEGEEEEDEEDEEEGGSEVESSDGESQFDFLSVF